MLCRQTQKDKWRKKTEPWSLPQQNHHCLSRRGTGGCCQPWWLLSGSSARRIKAWEWGKCVVMASSIQHKGTLRPACILWTSQISVSDLPWERNAAALPCVSLGVDVNLFLTTLECLFLPSASTPRCLKPKLSSLTSDVLC